MWRWSGLVGLVLVSVLVGIGQEETVLAKEIRFIVGDVPGEGQNRANQAIWTPSEVLIDQKADLGEPLYFVLENPTGTVHEFVVHGLYRLLPDQKAPDQKTMVPIKVQVKANSTEKIEVSPEGLNQPKDFGAQYRFSCPVHREFHQGGVIRVD